jgi:hypothetical protein
VTSERVRAALIDATSSGLKNLAGVLPDVLLLAGAAAVIRGCWIVAPPLGWVVGGALAIFAGWRLAR